MQKMRKFVKPYIWYIMLAAIASAVNAIVNVWLIDMFRELIDNTMSGKIENIYMVIVKGIVMILCGMISNYAVCYTTEYFGAGILRDMRGDTMKHIIKMPPDYLENNNFGDIVTRMTNELGGIADYMEQYLKDWIYLPIMVIVYSIYLINTNEVLAGISIAPLLLLVPLSVILMKPIKLDQRKYSIELGLTNNNIQEVCDGIEVIKSYNLESDVEKKYYNALYKTFVTSNRNDIRQYNMEPINMLISNLPVCISLCLGGFLVFNGNITLGILVAFVSLMRKYVVPLSGVYAMVIKGQVALIGVKRVFEILEVPTETEAAREKNSDLETIVFNKNTGNVAINSQLTTKNIDVDSGIPIFTLENVTFTYAGENRQKNVLDNVSLDIEWGKKIALVGRSGGGKSTILKMLYRHYEVTNGNMYFCGENYKNIEPDSFRDNVSLISQDCYLFPMSIADNIKLGNDSASMEDIKNAARLANCEEFIEKMSEGYDSMVGEKGTFLSGGQKQRISIARAILKDAPILLLDEPTSALDKDSEEKVNEAMKIVMVGRTVVIVAHRLTTITDSDKIVVVDGGKIIEQGTHDELINENGLYKQLYDEYRGEAAQ